MKKLCYISFIFVNIFLFGFVSCDKENDEPYKLPDKTESSNDKNEETDDNKEIQDPYIIKNRICAVWKLNRYDSGLDISTTIQINNDTTCTYSQTFKYDELVNEYKLYGRWQYNSKDNVLILSLLDYNSDDKVQLITTLSSDYMSFKIKDEYSQDDYYSFKKQ